MANMYKTFEIKDNSECIIGSKVTAITQIGQRLPCGGGSVTNEAPPIGFEDMFTRYEKILSNILTHKSHSKLTERKKSRIRETPNLSTNVNRSTDTEKNH